MSSRSSSSKRLKFQGENLLPHHDLEEVENPKPNQEDSEDSCSICLHSIADRTVIPKCSHEFCFECLLVWTEQSRRCPLCSQAIGEYLIHSIRSRYDYRKHYLPSLRTSPLPSRPARTVLQTTRQRRRREREWGTRARESDEADKLERSIAKRRWIYRHDLYAKHVASNAYTKYRPYPTTAQFAASQDLISRTTTFLRRELQIWEGLDVEFLTTLIISLMKSIDIRSESAVKLISEFLDMDTPYTPGGRHVNAEHFAHEVYSYVRSPYKDLFVYDKVVQYDVPSHLPQPTNIERSHRWREPSPVQLSNGPSANRSQKRSRSGSSERSTSWSPSGRKQSPVRKTAGSGSRRTPVTPQSSEKHRRNEESDHIARQYNLGEASQSPVASSSNEREEDTPILGIRDVKGKRKDDEIKMTITPCESEIVEPSLVQLPVVTDKENKLDRTLNGTPVRIVRVPRNRTLQASVKAHLALAGESDRQDPVPSLLTRLSDSSYVPPVNSTKARNILGDCQQDAGDNDHARHLQRNPSHCDNLPNTNSLGLPKRPSSPRSQDSKTVTNYSTRAEKDKPTSFKNSHVSVHRLPLIALSMSSARPSAHQHSVTASTSVEDNAMTIPSYQSRSSLVPSLSQNQVDLSDQIPHVQSFIDGPLAHSLNSVETRARLLARLEMEKRQVVQLSASDSNYSHHDRPSCSSSLSIVDCDPLEADPDVRGFASDTLVSEGSRKRESKLRARAHAQLRVRLANEKRMNLDG